MVSFKGDPIIEPYGTLKGDLLQNPIIPLKETLLYNPVVPLKGFLLKVRNPATRPQPANMNSQPCAPFAWHLATRNVVRFS